jgi:hypothetical protein
MRFDSLFAISAYYPERRDATNTKKRKGGKKNHPPNQRGPGHKRPIQQRKIPKTKKAPTFIDGTPSYTDTAPLADAFRNPTGVFRSELLSIQSVFAESDLILVS